MRKILTLVLAALFMVVGGAAHADSGPQFDVTTEGIALHEGVVFGNQHNIHLDYIDDDGDIRRVRGNDLSGPEGESFVSWAGLGINGGKVVFVHVTGLGKWTFHKGVPVGPKPGPGSETRTFEEYEEREVSTCPDQNVGYGYVSTVEDTIKVTEERTSTFVWDATALSWIETWSNWTETDREVIESETISEREMTDAEYAECGMPPTGAGQVAGLAGIALLALIGGTYLLRRSKA